MLRLPYCMLGIVLAGCVVLAVSLLLAPNEANKPEAAEARRVVYVNVDRLMPLHPSSNALAAMRRIASEVGLTGQGAHPSAARSRRVIAVSSALRAPIVSVSRDQLEADVAQAAVSALRSLESAQREALQARLRAARQTMEESASAEIRAQVREIEREASEKLRDVAERYAADRVNANLKISALGVARSGLTSLGDRLETGRSTGAAGPVLVKEPFLSGGLGASEPEGRELAMTEAKLSSAQADLARIIDASANENTAVKAEARAKIEALWSKSAADIDEKLSTMERDVKARIEKDITAAQNEIIREISSIGKWFGAGSPVLTAATEHAGAFVTPARRAKLGTQRRGPDFSPIDRAVIALEERIRLDVCRAVRILAKRQGLEVSFVRRGDGLPDRTREFEEKLRHLSWDVCGPVLCSTPD